MSYINTMINGIVIDCRSVFSILQQKLEQLVSLKFVLGIFLC